MLLDDLLEASVIQLCELCQVVYVRDDVAQLQFQQVKVLGRRLFFTGVADITLRRLSRVQHLDHPLDIFLAILDALVDFHRLELFEVIHLVQFVKEPLDERRLIFVGPCFRSVRTLTALVQTVL